MESGNKTCRFCGEEIKAVAIVCRHCGMNLETGASTRAGGQVVQAKPAPPKLPERELWTAKPSHIVYLQHHVAGITLAVIGVSLFFTNPVFTAILPLLGLLNVLWAIMDRNNRIFTITSTRVMEKRGIIAKRSSEVDVADIRNVIIKIGIVDRIFGIGNIGIASAGTSGVEVRFMGVESPDSVRQLIINAKDEAVRPGATNYE